MQIEKWAIGALTVVIAILLGVAIFSAENRNEYPLDSGEGASEAGVGPVADARGGHEIRFDDARKMRYRTEDVARPPRDGGAATGGAAGVAARGETAVRAGEGTTTVGPNETFSHISRRVYGSASYWKLLVSANPDVDPRKMRPGQVIVVPPLPSGAKDTAVDTRIAAAGAGANDAVARVHTVRSRETLRGIAKRYYDDPERWNEIFEANRDKVKSPRSLVEGAVLVIP